MQSCVGHAGHINMDSKLISTIFVNDGKGVICNEAGVTMNSGGFHRTM